MMTVEYIKELIMKRYNDPGAVDGDEMFKCGVKTALGELYSTIEFEEEVRSIKAKGQTEDGNLRREIAMNALRKENKFRVGQEVRVYGLMDPLSDYKGRGVIRYIGPMHSGGMDMLWIIGFSGAWHPGACVPSDSGPDSYGTPSHPSFSQRNGLRGFRKTSEADDEDIS